MMLRAYDYRCGRCIDICYRGGKPRSADEQIRRAFDVGFSVSGRITGYYMAAWSNGVDDDARLQFIQQRLNCLRIADITGMVGHTRKTIRIWISA